MDRGLAVQVWKEWGIHILVALSFLLQVVLLALAGIRRRNPSAALMGLLWLAYLMADEVAAYALGHMTLDSRPHKDGQLVALWAPFFLLHLGGQDNITDYSLEDNQLWRRHLLTLLVQASGAGYAIYRYILPGSRSLMSAAILVFIVGLLKYGERVSALKGATASLEDLNFIHDINHQKSGQMDADEELLLHARNMFQFCKSSFINVSREIRMRDERLFVGYIDQSRLFNRGIYLYDLAEAELSLLYDWLYTKVPVINTWQGFLIRVTSMLATGTAFFLFHLGGKIEYSRVDVAITYLLLVGALTLEILSVLRVLGSTWTVAYLDYWEFCRTNAVIMRIRRLVKVSSKRRWSDIIGQHNVLDYCSRDKTELIGWIAEAIGPAHWWKRVHFSSTIPITTKFKVLVVQQIVNTMRDYSKEWKVVDAQGRGVLTEYGILGDVSWSVEGRNFGDCILIWHVATDIFILGFNEEQKVKTEEEEHLVKAMKVLSNYMGFLVLSRPELLPGGAQIGILGRHYNAYECQAERMSNVRSKDMKLSKYLHDSYRDGDDAQHFGDAEQESGTLAGMLLRNKWELPNMLQIIFAVWVEFLCYAAHHTTSISHCKQLGRGGEFLSVVRLVVDHNELFQGAEDERTRQDEITRKVEAWRLAHETEDL